MIKTEIPIATSVGVCICWARAQISSRETIVRLYHARNKVSLGPSVPQKQKQPKPFVEK